MATVLPNPERERTPAAGRGSLQIDREDDHRQDTPEYRPTTMSGRPYGVNYLAAYRAKHLLPERESRVDHLERELVDLKSALAELLAAVKP